MIMSELHHNCYKDFSKQKINCIFGGNNHVKYNSI